MSANTVPGKQNHVIVVLGSLVLVALVGVIIALVMLLNRQQPAPVPQEEVLPPQRSVLVNEENVDEVVEDILASEPVAPGYYEARMSTAWTFPDGTSASPDAYVENVTNNTNNVYFDVLLADTDETIYESPVIPLGGHLDNIVLDRDLDPGDYSAVVVYHLIDDMQRTLSTLRMAIAIHVEN